AADEKGRIAMRVVADHIRTLAFAIADGAQPGNTGRGYVIRRILRRAVRYGYQTRGFREPFLHALVGTRGEGMGDAFPETVTQRAFIERVIKAEEEGFLKTLASGIERLEVAVRYVRALQETGLQMQMVDTTDLNQPKANRAMGASLSLHAEMWADPTMRDLLE